MVGIEFSLGLLQPLDCRKESAIQGPQFEAEKFAAIIEQVVWRATAAAVKQLQVEVCDGEIILTGRCRTYYTKQVAQHAAMGAAVGWNVLNRIDVA